MGFDATEAVHHFEMRRATTDGIKHSGVQSAVMSVISTLRNPAHTGARRCVPCTIVNLFCLWVTVSVVVVLGWPVIGGAVLIVGLAIIWLRGYLIPYTPQFGPRLVAAVPGLDRLYYRTNGTGALSADSTDGEEMITELAEAGILSIEGEQLFLDPAFESRWHEEMDALADAPLSELADECGSLPTVSSARAVEHDGQQWIALGGQTALVAQHVAVAELGAVRALDGSVPDEQKRLAMARPLREFLSTCPVCATPFEASTSVSCCGGHTNPQANPRDTLVCPQCEQRFATLPEPVPE